MIAMAHPDLFATVLVPSFKDRQLVFRRRYKGPSEFRGSMLARFDPSAQVVHHDLLSVTDAKDRNTHLIGRLRWSRAAFAHHAVGAAGENDRLRLEFLQERLGDILIGVDFTIDVQLAQATGDQLGHLAAEVDDEKAVMLGHVSDIRGTRNGCKMDRIRCAECRFRPGSDVIRPGRLAPWCI